MTVEIGGSDVTCGYIAQSLKGGRETLSYSYDQEYLRDPSAFALCPGLPLTPSGFYSEGAASLGAFGDTMPDRWGRVLMARRGHEGGGLARLHRVLRGVLRTGRRRSGQTGTREEVPRERTGRQTARGGERRPGEARGGSRQSRMGATRQRSARRGKTSAMTRRRSPPTHATARIV